MQSSIAFEGVYRYEVDGLVTESDVILCCPGDWPEIEARLINGEQWSTMRVGTKLIAIGPPRGPAVDLFREYIRKHGIPAWARAAAKSAQVDDEPDDDDEGEEWKEAKDEAGE